MTSSSVVAKYVVEQICDEPEQADDVFGLTLLAPELPLYLDECSRCFRVWRLAGSRRSVGAELGLHHERDVVTASGNPRRLFVWMSI